MRQNASWINVTSFLGFREYCNPNNKGLLFRNQGDKYNNFYETLRY